MKKKIVLLFTTACLCAGLTACGNPLNDLPEATGENIYDAGEETTGNEFADDIIDKLMDEGVLLGDQIVSFVVNDRDDDEDSKERSELSVEITTESDTMEYVYYYVVDCKYSDDRGWRIKEYELNEDEESTVSARTNVTEDDFVAAMERISSVYFGSTYVYFEDGEFTDITFRNEKIVPGIIGDYNNEYPTENLTVTFTLQSDFCYFTRDIDMEYSYYNDQWNMTNWELSEDYTTELTAETLEALSDERMLADLAEKSIYVRTGDINVTDDLIDSYTFGDYSFSGNTCYRDVEITLKGSDIYTINVSASYTYKYTDSGWELSYVSPSLHAVEQNIAGNYSGTVHYSSGTAYATVYYSILEVNDDGTLSGALKWVPDGEDAATAELHTFTGKYYMDIPYISIYLDEQYYLGGWIYLYNETLYYNPIDQTLEASSLDKNYILTKDS